MRYPLLLAALTCAALSGCERPQSESAAPSAAPAASSSPASSPAPEAHTFSPAITAEDFLHHTTILASDAFAGRAPGTQGETLTIEYLRDYFKSLGLSPGNGDDWYQSVPMVETTAAPVTAAVAVKGKALEWSFGSQWVAGTRTGQETIEVID